MAGGAGLGSCGVPTENLGLRRKLQGEGQGRRLAAVHAAFIWRGKHAEQRRPPTVLVLGARGVALRGLRGGYCERRAHRYGSVQLRVLVVHLERGRLARSGRQECELAGGCKAAVGQGRVYDGCVSEAPSAMWHGAG